MTKVNVQRLFTERITEATRQNIPAPIGGWNTRDSLSLMPAIDAISLDNFFPQVGSVKSRGGSEEFATGFGADIETITSLNSSTVTRLAAASDKIFTWTDIKGNTATQIGAGFTNARWQTVNMGDSVLMFNGADTPQRYNGSLSSLAIVLKDGAGTTIVGTDATDMDGCNVFKNRLYIWSTTEKRFFVGDTNAIQGDFTEFDLSGISDTGGRLMAMGTITHDGGFGADDLAVFIMTTGEVIVYNGDNPTSATNWSLEGKYKIPPPISVRGITRFKGDLKIITEADQVSLLEVIGSGGLNVNPSKLSGAFQDAVALYKSNYGWEADLHPASDMLIYNIPKTTNSSYDQYVINTTTGAACRFTDWNARTFGVIDGELYYGLNGTIRRANVGFDDETADIVCVGERAFFDFGIPMQKSFLASKEIIRSAASLGLTMGQAIDFGIPTTASPTTSTASGTQWDIGQWDAFNWADELSAQIIRFALLGSGVAISTKLSVSLNGDSAEWFRTDHSFKVNNTF
jgi:hypothetical protein